MKKKLLERQAALRADVAARLSRVTAAEESGSQIDFAAELAEVEKLNTELAEVNKQVEAAEKLEAEIRQRATTQTQGTETGLSATGATVRANILDKPWQGLGEFLQAVHVAEGQMRSGRSVDERLASGFNEGVGNEGAFLVGTDIANTLISTATSQSPLASRCSEFTISSGANGVKIPAIADKNRTDGNRYGGVAAYWAPEAATYTAATPKPFERVDLELKKLTALTYVTEEMLQDASVLQNYINLMFPAEIAFKIEDVIMRGTGAGIPLGFLNAPCLVTQAAEGSQTAATVNAKNVVKMYSRMPASLKSGAVWFINSEVFPQLQLMTSDATSAAQTVYMPPAGLSQAPYGTLLGRPIFEIEHASALGTVGDIMFVNMGGYALARKGGLQQQTSMHVRFLFDETAYKFTLRIDGRPLWNSTITPYKGSNSQSPFVVLAAR